MKLSCRLCFLPLLPLALLVACVALPDVRPFADATAKMRDGLAQSGELTVARLADGKEVRAPAEGEAPSNAWRLQQIWKTRLFAADSLVAYADALAQITAAGHDSANAANRLGGTLQEIAGQIPGVGEMSPQVVALGQKLIEVAIKVKASSDLAQALENAEPAVEGIAEVLVADLQDVRRLYKVGYRNAMDVRFIDIEGSEQAKRYQDLRAYRDELQSRVKTLREELKKKLTENTGGDEDAGDLADELRQAEQLFASAEADFKPLWQRLVALESERENVEALISHTEKAVDVWLETHRDLSRGIREERQPNWRVILTQVQELYELAQAVRESKEAADALSVGDDPRRGNRG